MNKLVKELAFFIGCSLLLLAGIFEIKNSYSALNGKSKYVVEQEVTQQNVYAAKQVKINESYDKIMTLAETHEGQHIRLAIKNYKDAKSIYPYRMEPRLALAQSYVTLSREKPVYCKLAEKEIDYAWQYIPKSQSQKYVTLLNELETKISHHCL